jgi:hypothetical protein
MTDRELLELAAKAAGIDWIKDCVWIENGFYSPLAKHERIAWNPLTDDGDALRLAVNLGLKIEHYSVTSEGRCRVGAGTGFPTVTYEGDAYAATRRAIVRAAAEIGKDMK